MRRRSASRDPDCNRSPGTEDRNNTARNKPVEGSHYRNGRSNFHLARRYQNAPAKRSAEEEQVFLSRTSRSTACDHNSRRRSQMTQEMFPEVHAATKALEQRIALTESEIGSDERFD